jgi:uncharacterized protein YbjT (DUF2867 family)
MRILIIGGTGTVGSAVAERLRVRGIDHRILTRRTDPTRADFIHGDLRDVTSVRAALTGIDRVFLLTPLDACESELGETAVEALRGSAVERVVLVTLPRLPLLRHLPHFAAKEPIVTALKASGIPWTELQPHNFFQNDTWYRELILHGVYPQPLGELGVHRIDVRDIADAAVRALTEDGFIGQRFRLDGPEALGGPACAALWSAALGQQVVYAGDDLERFRITFRPYLPGWLVDDFADMYRHFQQGDAPSTADDQHQTLTILGRPQRRYRDYVRDTAALWLVDRPHRARTARA